MELPTSIRDFLIVWIRKGIIKEVTFEVGLEGSGRFGSFRTSWEMKKLGPFGRTALRLGSWTVGD